MKQNTWDESNPDISQPEQNDNDLSSVITQGLRILEVLQPYIGGKGLLPCYQNTCNGRNKLSLLSFVFPSIVIPFLINRFIWLIHVLFNGMRTAKSVFWPERLR